MAWAHLRDNENSIVAVRKTVAKMLKLNEKVTNVQEESPVPYDSQSNGAIEVGVRLVRGMYRTLKLCLEARIGKYIEGFYNPRRRHSSLGYKSPAAFETAFHANVRQEQSALH